ncbi:DNA adenine methylase [Aquimarina latercula]|uniref:DNA adenine methylase n=1 Tax=Aquimarina latercula TaxID=987 RepID=UPI00041B6162|nr:DNA adenine methylase [Aquimarina latercula]
MQTTKQYMAAPLPFQGQKRNLAKQFKAALNKRTPPKVYVDLFGGSGLLSRIAKDVHPQATVVYNDYDNYRQRIQHIPATNRVLNDIRKMVVDLPAKTRIPQIIKNKIIERIEQETGYLDYITLSTYLLFSMNFVNSLEELKKQTFYNRVRHTEIPEAKDYLKGLEVVFYDYRELFERYNGSDQVVFIVDPPYLSTDCGSYKNYWKLKEHLDVLKVLKGGRYIYFTSNKSNVVELCEWIETNTGGVNPFYNAETISRTNIVNYQSSYSDIMLIDWEI